MLTGSIGQEYGIEKIFDVVLAFNTETSYDQLLNIILTKMMDITNSDAGTLYILEDNRLCFRIIKNTSLNISRSMNDVIDLPPIMLNENNIENVSAYAAINNEIIAVDDVYANDRFNFSGPKAYDKITGYRTQSMLVLPLASYWDDQEQAKVMGVIQLINAMDAETGAVVPFGGIYDPPVIPALSNVASSALANLVHVNEIKQVFHSIVSVMTQAIDERSSYNSGHTRNVARYCYEFAKYLRGRFPAGHPYCFSESRLEQLAVAAMLHDIGKIITPLEIMDKADRLGGRLSPLRYRFEMKRHQLEIDMLKGRITDSEYAEQTLVLNNAAELVGEIVAAGVLTDYQIAEVRRLAEITYRDPDGKKSALLEPEDIEALSVRKGSLTDGERKIMQEHAALTGRLLDSITFWQYYKHVPEWARSHHEFMDGTGYPRGLKGDELPPEARILTIADIFEALTAADRPYKKAIPVDKSLAIMSEMAKEGKLHGELVELFAESEIWLNAPESDPAADLAVLGGLGRV